MTLGINKITKKNCTSNESRNLIMLGCRKVFNLLHADLARCNSSGVEDFPSQTNTDTISAVTYGHKSTSDSIKTISAVTYGHKKLQRVLKPLLGNLYWKLVSIAIETTS